MIRYSGMENVPGAPGNTLYSGVDLPFGGGGRYRTIQEQYRPGQRREDPVRSFPKNEPGREGAIDIDFRKALMNSPSAIGNMGGMMSMLPGGFQGPAQGPNTPIQYFPGMGYGPMGPASTGIPPMRTNPRGEPISPQAAGFAHKFVS